MDAGSCGGLRKHAGMLAQSAPSPHMRQNLLFAVFKISGRESREDGRYKKTAAGRERPSED